MKELKKQGYTVEDIPDSVEGRAIGVTVYLGEGAMSTYIDIQAKWDEAPQRSAIIVENAIVYTTVYQYPARDGTCQDPVMVCQYTIVFFVHI